MKRLLPWLVLIFVAAPVVAQAHAEAPKEEVPTVKLTLRPVPEPEPALKYQLLPGYLDQTPGNAAALYRTAAMLLGRTRDRQKLMKKVVDWLDVPLGQLPPEEVRAVLEAFSDALHYAGLAARRERCDWDVPIRTEHFAARLPELSHCRDLTRLFALQARLEVADGQYEKALETLQTGFSMARHVADGETLIHGLVGIAIAAITIEQLEAFVQTADAPNLYWALTSLPRPFVDLRDAMQIEMNLVYLMWPELKDAETGQLTAPQWKALMDRIIRDLAAAGAEPAEPPWEKGLAGTAWAMKVYPQAKRYLVESGRAPEQVEAMLVAQVLGLYSLSTYNSLKDELFKWFYVPYWQARAGLQEAEARLGPAMQRGEGSPFTTMLPAVGRANLEMAFLDRRIAALRCVEAVRMYAATHDGKLPASLTDISEVPIPMDPLTGEDFHYEVVGETAVLYGPPPPDRPKRGIRYELTVAR